MGGKDQIESQFLKAFVEIINLEFLICNIVTYCLVSKDIQRINSTSHIDKCFDFMCSF